jgi:neutral ceramidase
VAELQAGVAAVNITPPVGSYLQGYTRGEPSIGVHLDLYAKAIVFDDGVTRAAIVTTDLIGLEQVTIATMRQEIARRTDIQPNHVLINASHSHGGPTVQGLGGDAWGWLWGNPADLEYGRELARKVGGLVAMADRVRRPVALGYGVGDARFNINRRRPIAGAQAETAPNPEGVVDHRVKVVKLIAADGVDEAGERPAPAPLAVLFSFTCHPTIMAMANLEISPDYPGVAQAFVEQAYGGGPTTGSGLPDGPGTLALFAQGCCGNIRPNLATSDGQSFRPGTKRDAHRLGRILGAEAVKVCETIRALPGERRICAASLRTFLPYQQLPDRAALERLAAGENTTTHNGHRTTTGGSFGDAEWARVALSRIDAGGLPNGIEAEVQALQIGDLTIVGLPGEVFAEIGFQIEQRMAGPSLVLGYSNGNVGYLCTQSSYAEGGYEPSFSWMLYVHPAPFEPANEHTLVRAGRDVVEAVSVASGKESAR